MNRELAINVKGIDKVYKLYDRPKDRLKDELGLVKSKNYKEHFALRNVDMQVYKGETVGIIGTNGSGKSTMLKIITGVLNPTAGDVEIDGRISALLELGAGFNMEYTGIQNVYLNGTMMGFSKEEIDVKLQDILDFADIGDFVNQPVKTYSSGMFVRLAFAVAINIEPEILIVDEALSVGDVFFQAKCYHKFEEFKKMGKTIVFVSHDLSSIAQYCDRVFLLNRGKMLADGSPKDMVNLYKRILVQDPSADIDMEKLLEASTLGEATGDTWKEHFTINPQVDEYGNGEAQIIDFAVTDEDDLLADNIIKGSEFKIKVKVLFNCEIKNPIFTYTIKDLKGTAVTGTNTMYENVDFGTVEAGTVKTAEFSQVMTLQGGEYMLSISCTGYKDGEFVVYHRLYDVINLTVISERNTVGFVDLFATVKVD